MFDQLIIRKADYKDLYSIVLIEKEIFKEDQWSLKMIEEELNNSYDRCAWVISLNKKILGYYMVRYSNDEISIMNIAVIPSFQGKGIGRLMMDHLVSHFPVYSSIFLEVKKSNFPAINLYLSMGFKQIGIRSNYYQDGTDALLMHLGN